ncbi:MAG: hypothetical protein ABEJ35_02970 [Halobacteriaceae archaeon]
MTRWLNADGGLEGQSAMAARDLDLDGWTSTRQGPRTIAGTATGLELGLRPEPVSVTPIAERMARLGVGETRQLPMTGSRIEVPGESVLAIGVDGAGRLHHRGSSLVLGLDEPTALRLTLADRPVPEIEVAPDAAGIATAVTAAATGHFVDGPGRSHPDLRDRPPRLAVGHGSDQPAEPVPSALGSATIQVPSDRMSALAAAPFAYYLGAPLESGADEPTITFPAEGSTVRLALGPSATGQSLAAEPVPVRQWLERVVWLDCLLRARLGEGPAPVETTLLDSLDRSPATLAKASVAERARAARGLPDGQGPISLPTWHLATYVAPNASAVRGLPYLLDRMAHIYPPDAEPLDPETLMERSLDDFYRSSRPTPAVDLVEPTLQEGALHGWLAPETPVEAFKLLDGASTPPIRATPPDQPLTVTLVLNDPAMIDERTDVAAAYRRDSPLELSVTTHRELSVDALGAVVAAETDLLHFIGHCEPDGLVCPDGHLAAADIPESGAQVAFLNACSSYFEGTELVDRGSVASVITYRGVLDSQAATVGAAFARLVTRGFGLERAIRLARRQVMMGMDYGVVGDGTHRIAPGLEPLLLEVERADDDTFTVACSTFADGRVGETTTVPLTGDVRPRLRGGTATQQLDRGALLTLLEGTDAPVIFDGTVAWPAAIARRLREM